MVQLLATHSLGSHVFQEERVGQFHTAIVGHVLSQRASAVSRLTRVGLQSVVEGYQLVLLVYKRSLVGIGPPVPVVSVLVVVGTAGVKAVCHLMTEHHTYGIAGVFVVGRQYVVAAECGQYVQRVCYGIVVRVVYTVPFRDVHHQ